MDELLATILSVIQEARPGQGYWAGVATGLLLAAYIAIQVVRALRS